MNKQIVDMKNKVIITTVYPSSIIKDFRIYLTYLQKNKIKLTKANAYFTKKDLLAIYSLITHDNIEVPKHSTQIGYPKIHLFYHLSINLDFIRIKRTQTSALALVQSKQIDEFMELTSTEQYVTLLEVFWMETDWEDLQGETWNIEPNNVDLLFEELENYPANKVIQLKQYKDIENTVYRYGQFFYYFSYFGFWTFEIDEIESNKPDRPKRTVAQSIMLTPFFKQVSHILLETWYPYQEKKLDQSFHLLTNLFNLPNEIMEEINLEKPQSKISLISLLKPLFPSGQLNTTLKKQVSFIRGTYLLKVKLHQSCWRVLELSSSHTLLDVHNLIQMAFNFDDDHLYAFYMDGKKFSKHHYIAPMGSEGPYVDEVKIGDMNLYEEQSFLYLFDFGDEWEFDIQVEKIIEGEEVPNPRIKDEYGKAPNQYSW
ncbi:plasmid pRiA4b ORF-3 family protein [Aquibacillus salsiterrae]|uniref:Plasmid pRiA4b ORF-3 family protein n=1 Tax=Aquibacillus salsiterrae TaxID=2950439 RepID=A0A9X3WH99_9BACI|nr:plasmid pRiA4b ORF-3 family protein [Aquibacillus salsiterrae]MDC3417434.1 plasmid pRiA4b ORF-3 family protein [Aquibacillus salsiterrae]